MAAPDLTEFSYLWDGSEPGWCLRATHRYERRFALHFDASGPSVREVAAMRTLFEEFRGRTAEDVWAEVRGKETLALEHPRGPIDGHRLAQAARDRGFRVEVCATHTVVLHVHNETTGAALVVEDETLREAIVARLMSEGVPVRQVEVD